MGIFLHFIEMLPAHPLGGQAVEIALVFGIIGHWRPRHARRAKNRLSVYRRRSYGLFGRRLQGPLFWLLPPQAAHHERVEAAGKGRWIAWHLAVEDLGLVKQQSREVRDVRLALGLERRRQSANETVVHVQLENGLHGSPVILPRQ